MLHVKDLEAGDIKQMVSDDLLGGNPIRQQDKDELFAFSGKPFHKVLLEAHSKSPGVAVIDEQGYVLVIFGLAPQDDYKVGWLVGTERGQLRGRELHRLHREYLRAEPETVKAYTIHLDLDKWHAALGFHPVTLWETPEGRQFKEYIRTP